MTAFIWIVAWLSIGACIMAAVAGRYRWMETNGPYSWSTPPADWVYPVIGAGMAFWPVVLAGLIAWIPARYVHAAFKPKN